MKQLLVVFLLALTSFFSSAQDTPLTLSFHPEVPDSSAISLTTLKGYISNIRVDFTDSTSWKEANSYHLVNYLDSANTIQLEIPSGKQIAAVHYLIGTDSIANVSGVYDGDLDPILGMYWAWNSGYINWKAEGTRQGEPFEYHIGGYLSPYATARPVAIETNAPLPNTIRIDIKIGKLLDQLSGIPKKVMMPGASAQIAADAFSDCFELHE